MPKTRGFSLIELSIVLVILGLLTGGILAGRSLIRASELRAVTTEHGRYRTAVMAFRDKYFYLPGDITNATSIWGKDTSTAYPCSSAAGSAGNPGTCNGDGNGQIGGWDGSAWGTETYRMWQHLALAGLIDGTYSGLYISGNIFTPGTNCPASKMNNGGWFSYYSMTNSAYGNFLGIGKTVNGNAPANALFRPEEAWNLDNKTDDGMPNTGTVYGASGISDSTSCINGTLPTDIYRLTDSTPQCRLTFARQF